jgi:hypothetical protein
VTTSNAEATIHPKARLAGLFYSITFVTGTIALFVRGNVGMVAGLIAGAAYVVVTVLFYGLFKPVNRGLSLLAAIVSLAGCAIGPLGRLDLIPFKISPLVFFGVYCLLIGYLILKSTFLPGFLGGLMVFGGLGWLIFLSPPLAAQLSPYLYFPGMIGEGVLTVWLLVAGVNVQRWQEQARATGESIQR